MANICSILRCNCVTPGPQGPPGPVGSEGPAGPNGTYRVTGAEYPFKGKDRNGYNPNARVDGWLGPDEYFTSVWAYFVVQGTLLETHVAHQIYTDGRLYFVMPPIPEDLQYLDDSQFRFLIQGVAVTGFTTT